jgi:hypothetical protein
VNSCDVIEKLERLVDEVGALQSKLVLLIGPPNAGKTALLHSLAKSKGVTPLNVGAELGGRLAGMPQRQRHLQTTTILRELADQHAPGDLLLLDNIELLFDRSLQLDPLDLLKRHAHAKTRRGGLARRVAGRCENGPADLRRHGASRTPGLQPCRRGPL